MHRASLLVVVIAALPAQADVHALVAEPQRAGDPAEGLRVLLNGDYVGCGVPPSIHDKVFGIQGPRLPGRGGAGAKLPYAFNRFPDPVTGSNVVAANCLLCHAAPLPGSGAITIGLGNAHLDFTADQSFDTAAARTAAGLGLLGLTDREKAAFDRWAERALATAPYLVVRTRGVNPADNLAAALFARRDRSTLAWLDAPALESPPQEPVAVDVPPWWHMKKKSAMFWTAAGRGDHARIMMTASTLCVDTVEKARTIDAQFTHVRAYIASLESPRWPWAIDAKRAARGRAIFEQSCARCHGTYGARSTYPNVWVDTAQVGTDPLLAGAPHHGARFLDWFNGSFFGERARLQPAPGYVAPPLDGVWATAPYLHNGSVPTLAALLDSRQRPSVFRRAFRARGYDKQKVGWTYEVVERAALPPELRTEVYDTSVAGYGNRGHTYADALADDERGALLEYLKTL